ncbi:unnamed protein product [Lepidochelys kempii]
MPLRFLWRDGSRRSGAGVGVYSAHGRIPERLVWPGALSPRTGKPVTQEPWTGGWEGDGNADLISPSQQGGWRELLPFFRPISGSAGSARQPRRDDVALPKVSFGCS